MNREEHTFMVGSSSPTPRLRYKLLKLPDLMFLRGLPWNTVWGRVRIMQKLTSNILRVILSGGGSEHLLNTTLLY